MSKVRWGILSTAKIAREDVIPAMQQGSYCEVTAIASRRRDRAAEIADALGIEIAVGSYEELLALPEIDAVYNPLPNHLHVEWSIKALQAGKHVLCEKPLGLSYADALKLYAEADNYAGLKVMEAFMYRHHLRWQKVKELITQGAVGRLRTVHSLFTYFNDDPDDIRNKPEMGGGGLMDIGCYCISVPRFLFGSEPDRVFGTMEIDPELQVDRLTSGILNFGEGRATFTCSTQLDWHQEVRVFGTEGSIEVPVPFNPLADRPTRILLARDRDTETIEVAPCNQYTLQGDRLSKAILDDREVPVPLDDALANMKVIDAVVESSKSRSWVTP